MHATPDPRRALARGIPWVTALVALAALAASLTSLAPSLQLERGGEAPEILRRALAAHLTHWSADHLGWDLLVLLVAGTICELRGRGRYVAALAAGAFVVSAAVLLEGAHLPYRGLSGIDAALVGLLAVGVARDELAAGRRAGLVEPALLLAAVCGKAAYEMLTGTTLFVDSEAAGMLPVPLAHLAGAAAGAAVALAPRQPRGFRPSRWRNPGRATLPSYASPRRKEAWPWTFAGKAWW